MSALAAWSLACALFSAGMALYTTIAAATHGYGVKWPALAWLATGGALFIALWAPQP